MNRCIAILVVAPFLLVAGTAAQQTSPAPGPSISTVPAATRNSLPDTPQILGTGAERYRVTAIKGLVNPWGLAFLPNGDILVTEKPGRLRIIRNGVLDPTPLGGLPVVNTRAVNAGLMDVALHPRYAENQYIYFTYSKPSANLQREDVRWDGQTRLKANGLRDVVNATLARARYDGGATLTDVRDIFIADAESQGTSGSRIAFAKDGKIIMTVGMPTRHMYGTADDAQNGANHSGKVLRLNDDGTAPSDNPFVKTRGYRPEIFALGIRNAMGLFVHPDTGEIWETENGPMGGDEINVIKAGKNYGWPVVSYGVDYSGNQEGGLSGTLSSDRMRGGMEDPFYFWNPSPSVTGIIVYTGDKFPTWKGNIFVGAMTGDNLGGRMVHRLSLSRTGRPQSRGNLMILSELKQRIRDVRQSPDGLIYCATDEAAGAILKIEPVAEGEP